MGATIISMNAWKATRKTGSRRLDPIRGELRELRSELSDDLQWLRDAEEEAARLQNRLDENLTRQGPNKGKPLSESNRYQIANSQKYLLNRIEETAKDIVELRNQIHVLEKELAQGQRDPSR